MEGLLYRNLDKNDIDLNTKLSRLTDINKFGLRITVASQIHLECQQIMNTASPNDFPGMFSRLIIHISVLSTSQMERINGI